MVVEPAVATGFIPETERHPQAVQAFFTDTARRLGANLNEPLPDNVATRIYTGIIHDEFFDTCPPATVKTLVLTRSRHALTVYGFDADSGTVSASFNGTEISFKGNDGAILSGPLALARARQIFGRDAK
jgi:hypothetical protein